MRLRTINESITSDEIIIISFIGEDEEGSEKGVKFAVKKPFTEHLFNTIKNSINLENVFPDTKADLEEETWEANESNLEKDLDTVAAELEESPYYVKVLEDYV